MSGNAFYFDQETRTQEAGEMRYTGRLSSAWNIGDHPNGGYMVTVVLNAIARVVSHPHPVSVTTHFLRPGAPEVPYE
ncbi:MAG: thioesterase family protein, partial [Pseudomonadales bacterium]|nr:thioesterase family protein [Pseudomonadales bacterium]